MNNYICTWFCEDRKGEESFYPQTGLRSSSLSHKLVYWRCIVTFYITSVKFNKEQKHLFFTNATELPKLSGNSVEKILESLGVTIIKTNFEYKTPLGYYQSWQNQFYEFSILEYIASNYQDPDDMFLILDSDCLFLKPAGDLFAKAQAEGGFLSYEMKYTEDYNVNGISRRDMKAIYKELLQQRISEIPAYHAGEFFLCKLGIIKKLYMDFLQLWPELMRRHKEGELKFNEEAHTLSYLYYKNGLRPGGANSYIKRIWTNPVFYRNVAATDSDLTIWHLPAEKTYGIPKLLAHLLRKEKLGLDLPQDEFIRIIRKFINIPNTPWLKLSNYYVHTYFNAIKKRLAK